MSWILLTYTLPTEPSALRVGVWRRLKAMGAILLHDAVWVLPATPRNREQFQWLASEITELGGEATYWEARLVMGVTEDMLIRRFQDQVDTGYRSLCERLGAGANDLESISREYQKLQSRDYFHSETGQRAREAILAARGDRN